MKPQCSRILCSCSIMCNSSVPSSVIYIHSLSHPVTITNATAIKLLVSTLYFFFIILVELCDKHTGWCVCGSCLFSLLLSSHVTIWGDEWLSVLSVPSSCPPLSHPSFCLWGWSRWRDGSYPDSYTLRCTCQDGSRSCPASGWLSELLLCTTVRQLKYIYSYNSHFTHTSPTSFTVKQMSPH